MRHVVFSLLVGLLLVATASAWAQSGLILPGRLLDNMTATMDPQTDVDCNEDIYASYRLGSRWHNTTDDRLWVCRLTAEGNPRWQIEDPAAAISLQDAHAIDSVPGVAGFTDVTAGRPLYFWPELETLGNTTARCREYGQGGFLVRECRHGAAEGMPMPPDPIVIDLDQCFVVHYVDDDPPGSGSLLEFGTLCNDASGNPSSSGFFAKEVVSCRALANVSATSDNLLMGTWPFAVTIDAVYCHYEGSAPVTGAQFSLGTGTHTAPTCAGPTSAATPQVVSNGALAAYTPLRVSVTNVPDPTTETYQVCARGVRQ